jgi:hypothetical protein
VALLINFRPRAIAARTPRPSAASVHRTAASVREALWFTHLTGRANTPLRFLQSSPRRRLASVALANSAEVMGPNSPEHAIREGPVVDHPQGCRECDGTSALMLVDRSLPYDGAEPTTRQLRRFSPPGSAARPLGRRRRDRCALAVVVLTNPRPFDIYPCVARLARKAKASGSALRSMRLSSRRHRPFTMVAHASRFQEVALLARVNGRKFGAGEGQ